MPICQSAVAFLCPPKPLACPCPGARGEAGRAGLQGRHAHVAGRWPLACARDTQVACLRAEAISLEGVRRLVTDDDAALLVLAEVATTCLDLSHAVIAATALLGHELYQALHCDGRAR